MFWFNVEVKPGTAWRLTQHQQSGGGVGGASSVADVGGVLPRVLPCHREDLQATHAPLLRHAHPV